MNPNTSKWAAEVSTKNISEAVQRIAFSYGYRWPIGPVNGEKVTQTQTRFLVFNPVDKSITYIHDRFTAEGYVSQIVSTFDQLVNLFTNPPANVLRVGSSIMVTKDGNVNVGALVLGADLFDKVVVERDIFLGRNKPVEVVKKKLPLVQFTYTSKTSGRTVREVLVVEMKDNFITGFDAKDKFRFKKFLQTKVEGAISLIGFADEP